MNKFRKEVLKMNFESSILKKETLSKTAAKEKESLIADFSKLMENAAHIPCRQMKNYERS